MSIADNLAQVRLEMTKACAFAGRKETDVKLIAVSKFHSVEEIEQALACGQKDFGENYFQEWEKKSEILVKKWPEINWHMIGHLQSRKAPKAAGRFSLLHTLDSEKGALALQKELERKGMIQEVLLEVNIAEEPQKSGLSRDELFPFIDFVQGNCPSLCLKGLMCIPPIGGNADLTRRYFRDMRVLAEKMCAETGEKHLELSMGMSADFPLAIQEGATIIRIGTAIFGPRGIKAHIWK